MMGGKSRNHKKQIFPKLIKILNLGTCNFMQHKRSFLTSKQKQNNYAKQEFSFRSNQKPECLLIYQCPLIHQCPVIIIQNRIHYNPLKLKN